MTQNQCSVEVLVVLHDIVRVIPGCLLLAHCAEVEASIAVLNGLKEHSESVLKVMFVQRLETQPTQYFKRTIPDRFSLAKGLPCPLHPFPKLLRVPHRGL